MRSGREYFGARFSPLFHVNNPNAPNTAARSCVFRLGADNGLHILSKKKPKSYISFITNDIKNIYWMVNMKVYRLFQALLALILLANISGIHGQYSTSTTMPSSEPINVNATAVPDHVTLSWTSNPKTTQTVTWRTDTTVKTGVVQYNKCGMPKDKRSVAAQVRILKTDLGDENIFTATLTGLKPGTRYYYKVGDGKKNWSPINSFRTEKKDTDRFKFLVFGDTQSKEDNYLDYSLWQSTVQNAIKANRDAGFFTVVGDEAQAGRSNIHWNYWFPASKGVIDSISYMPVDGNTECRDIDINRTKGEPTLYIGQFNVPHNGPYNNCQAYSYDYGNVHFVVLDSQLREEQKTRPNLLDDEKAWLEKDLSQTKKGWKVVFWHKPPYFTRAYRTNNEIKAAFTPILDKYHVDMVFNGHDHAYSRTYPINNDQIVSSPALGTVYVITGRSGSKVLDDNERKVWNTAFFDPQDMPNYIVVDVCGSRMEMRAYKMDGTLIDDYIIDKTSGDKPRTIVPSKYNEPWLVVNGVFLNQPLMQTSPSQINSKWYLPIKSVAEFLGGSESVSGNNETISLIVKNYEASPIWSDKKAHTVVLTKDSTIATLDNVPVSLPDRVVVDSDENFLISVDDMNTLFGFTWKYDSDRNILFLINPSKIGE